MFDADPYVIRLMEEAGAGLALIIDHSSQYEVAKARAEIAFTTAQLCTVVEHIDEFLNARFMPLIDPRTRLQVVD